MYLKLNVHIFTYHVVIVQCSLQIDHRFQDKRYTFMWCLVETFLSIENINLYRLRHIFPGWEFYHETGLRAALLSIFEKEWRERRELKRDGGFPYFYLRYFSKDWILYLQLLSRTPSGFFLYKNVLYRAAISSFALDLRSQWSNSYSKKVTGPSIFAKLLVRKSIWL